MTAAFAVRTTSRFERTFDKLVRQHRELAGYYAHVVQVLQTDPYNQSRSHPIKKLTDVPAGDGQYRIRIGRFRFRYDIDGQVVWLKACSLRREETYS